MDAFYVTDSGHIECVPGHLSVLMENACVLSGRQCAVWECVRSNHEGNVWGRMCSNSGRSERVPGVPILDALNA